MFAMLPRPVQSMRRTSRQRREIYEDRRQAGNPYAKSGWEAYRESVRRKYDDLDAEMGTVEGEWGQYKDAFVGVAEELCGRTSGKRGTLRSRKQGWGTEEVAKAVGEKREAWKLIDCIRDRGEQPPPA